MSSNSHGGRFTPATLTVFHDRLSRKVSPSREPHAFQGFEVEDGILPDGTITQVVMLGPKRGGAEDKRPDAKSRAIPLSSDLKTSPKIGDGGKVFQGSIEETESGLLLVRQPREGYVTRIFKTGLIRLKDPKNAKEERGARQRDLAELRTGGIKLEYHGIFPLELGSANIAASGETVEVMNIADVYDLTDPNERKFKGLDVPESREMGAEIPIGGAIICADLGFLTIHERGKEGFKIWDVTNDPEMWKLFRAYARADLERRLKEEKDVRDAAKSA